MQLFKKLFEDTASKAGASSKGPQPIKVFDHAYTTVGTAFHSPSGSCTNADELMKKLQSFANRARHGGSILPPRTHSTKRPISAVQERPF